MHAGLSFCSSTANFALMLALCDSKLPLHSKLPCLWFTVGFMTYNMSTLGAMLPGMPATFLKAQFPLEMLTFGGWTPACAWAVAYRWSTLDIGQSLPIIVTIASNFMTGLLSPHFMLVTVNALYYLVVPVYATFRAPHKLTPSMT